MPIASRSLELHPGAGSRRIKSARCDIPHSSWRSPNSDLHAGRHPGDGQSANGRQPQSDRRARAPRQHLPPASSSRTRGVQTLRRHPSLHELGWPGAHRLRRVSDFFPGAFKSHERRGRPFSKLRRRASASALAGIEHRHAAGDRRRHHDGARSVHPVNGAVRSSGSGHASHAPLGRALAARPRRLGPSAVWHCPGSLPS